jgi:hypothetical protein
MALCHGSGNFLPFKGKSHSLTSQAAWFFSFVKGKKSLLQRNPAHMTRAIVLKERGTHLWDFFPAIIKNSAHCKSHEMFQRDSAFS